MAVEPETRLMWIVQALAASAEEQRALYPDFVVVPDELALEHEEVYTAFRKHQSGRLSAEQTEALEDLDQYLGGMSGMNDLTLWEREALRARAEWLHVRELALRALRAMAWEWELPPYDRVRPTSVVVRSAADREMLRGHPACDAQAVCAHPLADGALSSTQFRRSGTRSMMRA
jgi:hypothetical protein